MTNGGLPAQGVTAGIGCLAIEDPKRLNFAAMRTKGGNRKKGMNRTMSYTRPGALRAKTIQKMEERGGIVRPVDPRNTSTRCPRCLSACKESRISSIQKMVRITTASCAAGTTMPTRTAHAISN